MTYQKIYQVSKVWFYGKVIPYFAKNNIELLRDDIKFIEQTLSKLPPERHKQIMREYYNVWKGALAQDDKNTSKEPTARSKANAFLRDCR